MEGKIKVVLDGFSFSDKESVPQLLSKKHTNLEVIENGVLTSEITKYYDDWAKELKRDFNFYIIVESDYSKYINRKIR